MLKVFHVSYDAYDNYWLEVHTIFLATLGFKIVITKKKKISHLIYVEVKGQIRHVNR